jgi:superfamily II DNA or RNA helicase
MQICLKIGNAKSQVIAPVGIITELREQVCSYSNEQTLYAAQGIPYWDGKIRLMNLKGVFPTGLAHQVVDYLKTKGHKVVAQDYRVRPNAHSYFPRLNAPLTPRYYQTESLEVSKTKSRGVFKICTGGGKSFTSAMIIADKKVRTLMVVPNLSLKDQLLKDYISWFGKASVHTDIRSDAPIIVCNFQKLMKMPPKLFEKFEMLMIDEFHRSASGSYQKINKFCINAYYRYGWTGTFMRSDGSDMEMHGVLSKVIYEVTTSDLIEQGFLVRPEINIINFRPNLGIPYNTRYDQAYSYLVKSKHFADIVSQIAIQKIKENKQTIILTRRVEHGRLLAKQIPDAVFLSGADQSHHRERIKKDFNEKRIRCIVATEIFGEGVDIPTIDVLINARAQKTEIQTIQGIGRALRLAPGKEKAEIYDFMFIGQRHLENHSLERVASYKKERAFVLKNISF